MKQMMKKRITALLLVFSLAALLSFTALAAGEEQETDTASASLPEVSITGEVYYGTDYVQFDIHGGEATNLFYNILYKDDLVYQHVHYVQEEDGVDHVGIEVPDGKTQDGYSIVVYTGLSAETGTKAEAGIRCLYADLQDANGTVTADPQIIGAVVDLVQILPSDFPETYYDGKTDYNRAEGAITEGLDGSYHCIYTPYTPPALTGSVTYVDSKGVTLKTNTIENITTDYNESLDLQKFTLGEGANAVTYYPTLASVTPNYYGQIDFTVLCRTYPNGEKGEYTAVIQYVDQDDKTIWQDRVTVSENYIYMLPQTFVHTSNVTNEDGVAQQQTDYYTRAKETEEYLYFCPGDAGTDKERTYVVKYEVMDQTREVTWTIQNLAISIAEDGSWTSTPIGEDQTYTVQPGETVTHNPKAITYNGTTYVPVQDEYTYTYGDTNLLQQVYYTPDGYVPNVSYTVTLQFVNIANNNVLQSQSVMVNPGADTEITCPAQFTAGGNTYVRLGGQSDTYRHSYYSPKRTYTIYYRDVNDTLYANTVITNIETVTTERTETGVTYIEDVTSAMAGAVAGGTATGVAYATGPAAGTGITGITDDTTGMNQAVNEEGQDLAEEREEQIAEGETPLAQAPGSDAAPEESIGENDTAKAGVSTALVTGGTIAALVVAAVLIVLIVTQRKRNRSTRH